MTTLDQTSTTDPKCEASRSLPANGGDMLKPVRKVIIFILGFSVVAIGIAMIVLPGPATIVIPAGLAILATEFVWARRWLNYLKRRAQEVADWTTQSTVAEQPANDLEKTKGMKSGA